MGAYLPFTAEAVGKPVDHCRKIRLCRSGGGLTGVRHFTDTWNATRSARLGEPTGYRFGRRRAG